MIVTTSIIEEDELLLDYNGRIFMNQLRKEAPKKAPALKKAVTKAAKKGKAGM